MQAKLLHHWIPQCSFRQIYRQQLGIGTILPPTTIKASLQTHCTTGNIV